jgi:hypothetical protein
MLAFKEGEVDVMSTLKCCKRSTVPSGRSRMLRVAILFVLSSLLHCVAAHELDRGLTVKRPRVAVIGSGVGGATAAYLIHNVTGISVTVLDANDVVGGRLLETVIDGRVSELGGSIGILANRYFVEFADLLGLQRVTQQESSAGIWNGERFVLRSDDSLWKKFKRCARMGMGGLKQNCFVRTERRLYLIDLAYDIFCLSCVMQSLRPQSAAFRRKFDAL